MLTHPWAPEKHRLSEADVALLLLTGEGEGGYWTAATWSPVGAKVGDLFLSPKSRIQRAEPGIIIYRLADIIYRSATELYEWEIVYATGGKPDAKPAR